MPTQKHKVDQASDIEMYYFVSMEEKKKSCQKMASSYRNEWFLVGSADYLLTSDVFGAVYGVCYLAMWRGTRVYLSIQNLFLSVWLRSVLLT